MGCDPTERSYWSMIKAQCCSISIVHLANPCNIIEILKGDLRCSPMVQKSRCQEQLDTAVLSPIADLDYNFKL